MERIVEQGILYDFYGQLLTDHQREIYEDAVYNDMSLGEIATEHGITRQGVHDLLKRCDKILKDYEDKLHLVEKFHKTRELVSRIGELNEKVDNEKEDNGNVDNVKEEIARLVEEILEEL